MAEVDFGGVRKEVCLDYIPDVAVGEYVDRARRVRDPATRRGVGAGDARQLRAARRSSRRSSATRGGRAAERGRGAPGRPAPTTRQHGGDRRTADDAMKYLDEFSDPDLARRLLDQIHAATTRPWAIMEVCGGQTHSIIRHGIDQLLPDGIEMIHGPGCPVCVTPAGDHRQGARDRGAAGRDLLLVRRHAAGAGQQQGPVPDQERRRRRPRRLLAARRAQAGPREPGPPGGVLRDRLRDHRAGQRDDRLPGQAARHRELLAAGLARAGAAGDRRDHGVADLPGPGVPRRRARVQRDGHGASTRRSRSGTRCPIVVTGFEPLDILEGIRRTVLQLEDGPARARERLPARGRRPRATRRRWRCCRTCSR